jgi:hypothetical protein
VAKCAAFLLFLVALGTRHAGAEHEVYYRYTVLGYIRDAAGKPRAGVPVELVREKTGFSYLARSDAAGLYVVVARLADDAVGERLTLRAGGATARLVARFDPADHRHERGTRVDFADSLAQEAPTAFAPTLERLLAQ